MKLCHLSPRRDSLRSMGCEGCPGPSPPAFTGLSPRPLPASCPLCLVCPRQVTCPGFLHRMEAVFSLDSSLQSFCMVLCLPGRGMIKSACISQPYVSRAPVTFYPHRICSTSRAPLTTPDAAELLRSKRLTFTFHASHCLEDWGQQADLSESP